MAAERLQKILARAGIASRRDAEELLERGLVTVNGTVARLGAVADAEVDAIKVDGKRIRMPEKFRYVLLNKPSGVMSTTEDPEGRTTVLDLLPLGLRKGLKPVGRLDFDTEGLIILTDDGDFAQRVAHPRYGSAKTYEVKVKGHPGQDQLESLRRGMVIDGRRTGPVEVNLLRVAKPRPVPKAQRPAAGSREVNSWWRLVLREGRNRQIREMFFRIGHPVQRLRRVAIGPVRDPKLERGGWRELEEREVAILRSKPEVAPPVPRPPAERPRARAARLASQAAASTPTPTPVVSSSAPRGTVAPSARATRQAAPRAAADKPKRRTGPPPGTRTGPRPNLASDKPKAPASRKPTAFDEFIPEAKPRRGSEDDFGDSPRRTGGARRPRPTSARPGAARPGGVRPGGARPSGARPGGARPGGPGRPAGGPKRGPKGGPR